MSRNSIGQTSSRYYRFSFCDGLEALSVKNQKTAFPSHFHPTFNVTLIYSGIFHTKLQDRLVLSPSGTILITNPQEVHANPVQKEGGLSFFTFYISQEFFYYCNDNKPVYFGQKTIVDDLFFARLHELSLKLTSQVDFTLLEAEFKSVFASLALTYGSNDVLQSTDNHALFHELLAGDRFEKFSLADAAKNLGIDKYKFLRLFKDQTGLTPNNYFIYRRIEKSKELLAEGKDLLSVAVDLGFYDSAHYANHFKKFTGVSPMGFNAGQ